MTILHLSSIARCLFIFITRLSFRNPHSKPIFSFCAFVCFFAISLTPVWSAQWVDEFGRKITVPDDPRRIVSLAPSITEIIFALNQESRLKGVTQFSDSPPEAVKLPSVGSYVHLDLEKIVALKPDLCIATKDGNPIKIIERLENLNIPIYVVNPKNLESIMKTMVGIGRLLNAEDRAKTIVEEMQSRVNHVKSTVSKASGKPRVFFQIGISPLVSAGTPTHIHELISLAGGKNVSEGPVPYPRYSHEQILILAPDVFIISSMARGKQFAQVKNEWTRWTDIPAVRNNRIYVVDSNLFDRPTPRLVDALELLATLIHPDLFRTKE